MTTSKKSARSAQALPDDVLAHQPVYIQSPVSEAVGQVTAQAFREVWEPKGWTLSDQEAYDAHQERLAFEAAGVTPQPMDDLDAQILTDTTPKGE
jgi:hypothetical protein